MDKVGQWIAESSFDEMSNKQIVEQNDVQYELDKLNEFVQSKIKNELTFLESSI
jgi:hypothetical protein